MPNLSCSFVRDVGHENTYDRAICSRKGSLRNLQ